MNTCQSNKYGRVKRLKRNIFAFIIILGAGVIIETLEGCSGDNTFSNPASTDPSAAAKKIASTDFQLEDGTDYDPFADMDRKSRQKAFGGAEGALEYFRLIAYHLVSAMNDDEARNILQKAVPTSGREAELAQVAINNPYLLKVISADFKDAIAGSSINNALSQHIQDSQFDEEALLQVSEALFDLEITLVTPLGQTWNASQPIPVFYVPTDDEASVIKGVDPDLNPITMSATISEAPYPFLALNFNEDSSLLYADPTLSEPTPQIFNEWHGIMNFFNPVSPAYAHGPLPHNPYYHTDIIQPVKEITIYNDHEPGFWNKPEIMLGVYWSSGQIKQDVFDLVKVDKTNKKYTQYAHKRTRHGEGWDSLEFAIWERDVLFDDVLAVWSGIGFAYETDQTLTATDAKLRVVQTSEDVNP